MAQSSLFWTTNGTGDGVSGGYTQAKVTETFEAWWASDLTDEGVFNNYQNELAVTASGGSASPVTIATGAGLVKGFHYINDAAGTKNIPTPASNTRIDRIVLRADWGSQTVRFGRVAGTEGGGAPSLTQTDNTLWEIPLAQASITTGGVVTMTDQREFLHPNIEIETAMIGADAVGSAAIGSAVIARSHIGNSVITDAKIAANTVTAGRIANRTRKIFIQAVYAEDVVGNAVARDSSLGQKLTETTGNAADVSADGWGVVPNDYVSGWSSVAVLVPGASASGSAYLANYGRYYTPGGSLTAGSGSFESVDVSGVNSLQTSAVTQTGISAGDVFHAYVRRISDNGTDSCTQHLYAQGWVVSYTADS